LFSNVRSCLLVLLSVTFSEGVKFHFTLAITVMNLKAHFRIFSCYFTNIDLLLTIVVVQTKQLVRCVCLCPVNNV